MAIAERTSTDSETRLIIEMLDKIDRPMLQKWGKLLEKAIEPDELDRKSRAVIRYALESVVHVAPHIQEQHIDDAFEAGSNVQELIEAGYHVSVLEGGGHSLHDGLEAVEMVIRARTKAGKPVPARGKGLGPNDMKKEEPWPDPPVFPMHAPHPRLHVQLITKYDPELMNAHKAWNDARFKLRKELTRRMQELLVTAMDTAILYPEPLLDHHMHAVFETGATAQEILETVLLTAATVGGHRVQCTWARPYEGGAPTLRHGIQALERTLEQREGHGLLAPRDKTSPKTGRISLTSGTTPAH